MFDSFKRAEQPQKKRKFSHVRMACNMNDPSPNQLSTSIWKPFFTIEIQNPCFILSFQIKLNVF